MDVKDLTDAEYAAYQGVYQAYAWQQGFTNTPITFRLPDDQYFLIGRWEGDHYEGFSLHKFFLVVADMDEGFIHSWEYWEEDNERFLRLTCTEDDSQSHPDYHEDNSGHASWHLTREGGE